MGERRMNVFHESICGWASWANLYQSIPAFLPLITSIWKENGWTMAPVEHCQAGTNAVFKVGDKIIKIFAPIESGCDTQHDYEVETAGLNYARAYVPAPTILCQGIRYDRYVFRYIVLTYIDGIPFSLKMFDYDTKTKIKLGSQLRKMTDSLNQSDSVLKPVDSIEQAKQNPRWQIFPDSFQKERIEYLDQLTSSSLVYVHGDLNGDNLIIDHRQRLYIIDFADARMAPIEYEWAVIICELFQFDKDYLFGYFGHLTIKQYIKICIQGLLIHDFGADIIRDRLKGVEKIADISMLIDKIREKLEENFS